MNNLLLLPDFVGHPICFRSLQSWLRDDFELRLPTYHDHWPYEDIASLASAIKESLLDWRPSCIIGYSFGGSVAFEIASQFPPSTQMPLIMLDSHLIANPRPVCESWLSEKIDRLVSPKLAELIASMQAIGEVNEDCVFQNLRLFPEWRPQTVLPLLFLIRCKLDRADAHEFGSWDPFFDKVQVFEASSSHQDVVTDPSALQAVSRFLRGANGAY
jgi:thioesterase domain-containing protein